MISWASRAAVGVLLLAGGAPAAFAQAQERVVYVSAVDRNGAPVLDLTAKDFIVREDGMAREVLRVAPTAKAATRRRTSTLANANAGPGRRRLGMARAERLQAAAADSIAVPELDAEVAFEVGLLLDQHDLLERQIETADRRVATLLDGETARRSASVSPAIRLISS